MALSAGAARGRFMDELMERGHGAHGVAAKASSATCRWSRFARARRSRMPGMMDTILNVGLTTRTIEDWENRHRRARRARQRAPPDPDARLDRLRRPDGGVRFPAGQGQEGSRRQVGHGPDGPSMLQRDRRLHATAFKKNKGFEFPIDDADGQLRVAIKAVFDSWMNPRAIEYRKLNKIDDDDGHCGQRPGDGVRQHGRGQRARACCSPAIPRPARTA